MVGSRSGAVGILAMLCLILTACFGGSSEDPGPTPGTRPQSAEPAEPTPTGGTHTSVGPAATPVDGYFGHEPVALKRGAPVALPDGVALLLTRDTGGVRSIERVVREGNELAWSTLSDGIAEVVDAAERGSNGYVYSWTASTDGTHLAALVCLAAESCWCGAPFRAGGALFVISDDAGANWRVERPADNQVGLVGWDEAANKAVLERPLGCGTNGSGDYWL